MSELSSLFPGVAPNHIEAAQRRFYTVELSKGMTVVEEGERDAAGLFLVEGNVAIRTGELEIASVGAGGLIGEVALFGTQMRIASVVTLRPCVFLVIDRKDYEALLEAQNPIAYRIEKIALNQIATRLRSVDARIAALGAGQLPAVEGKEFDGTPAPAEADAMNVLGKSRLFEGAPIGALDDVAARMEVRRFAAGDVICREGARGNDLYMLVRGEVEVFARGEDGTSEHLANLEPTDVFGMASVIQERPRMASCVARSDVVALRMDSDRCKSLVDQENRAGSVLRTALIRALADQVAYANAQFAFQSGERKRRTSELLARLGIEALGKHTAGP